MSASKVTLKLLIDKRTNRVVYGEAGKDFVDFLFTILSLPLGTATKLLSKENKMVGTLGNLYRSIEELSDTYIQPRQRKDRVLNPSVLYCPDNSSTMVGSLGHLYQSIQGLSKACFQMHQYKDEFLNPRMDFCPSSRITSLFSDQGLRGQFFRDEGFVNGAATYMVTDNLEVKVMSTVFIMDLFKEMDIKEVGSIEEKVIHLGTAEVSIILLCFIQLEIICNNLILI
ncbi:hypothetical protein LINPERPRIM_LOCUS18571 [Linum perenne]